jgi:hypothetical protein
MQKLQRPAMAFWAAVGLALALGIQAAHSSPVPLPRGGGGSCPLGYYAASGYCVSNPSNRQDAIQKTGSSFPLGWFSSGSYCVKNR